MAEDDDLITIVDVTDPDDPSYADIKTRRRALTDAELKTLKPMLEKVGAYKFFSMEFNFADGPAVKQFIDSVELEEYKRSKQRKIVQESMRGTVAGREVVIDAELIEKTFGLVDDGESVIKPKGETSGLHTFYIKPKYIDLCQNYRGVYLKLFKSEYSYFVNLAHQIQTYCCGGSRESQITLTQYRAVDLMIRGKPVNWNRYLLQNFQDKLRKYKSGPCALYFGGTLTALIYKALHVDYNLVNKPLLISPGTPERNPLSDSEPPPKSTAGKGSKARTPAASAPPKREVVRRTEGALTRAQKILAIEGPASESLEMEVDPPVTKSAPGRINKSATASKKRKRENNSRRTRSASKVQKKSPTQKPEAAPGSEPSAMEEDGSEDEDMLSSPEESVPAGKHALAKRINEAEKLGDDLVMSIKPHRLSTLFAQVDGGASSNGSAVALTSSAELWNKYNQASVVQHEMQLEHILCKQMLEQALRRVQELEEAVRDRDCKVSELESSLTALESTLTALDKQQGAALAVTTADSPGDDGNRTVQQQQQQQQQHPFKVRLKAQAKASAGGSEEDQGVAEQEQVAKETEDAAKQADNGAEAGIAEGDEEKDEGRAEEREEAAAELP